LALGLWLRFDRVGFGETIGALFCPGRTEAVRHGSYTSEPSGEFVKHCCLLPAFVSQSLLPRLNCGEPRMTPFLLQLALMLVVILLAAELFTNALNTFFPTDKQICYIQGRMQPFSPLALFKIRAYICIIAQRGSDGTACFNLRWRIVFLFVMSKSGSSNTDGNSCAACLGTAKLSGRHPDDTQRKIRDSGHSSSPTKFLVKSVSTTPSDNDAGTRICVLQVRSKTQA